MAVGDVWKLTSKQTLYGQQIMNTAYFATKTVGQRTVSECLALADAWKELWRVRQMDAIAYTTWEMREVYSVFVTYDTSQRRRTGGLVFDGAHTGTLTGAGTQAETPPQIAMVVTWLSGIAGRSNRGRSYLAAQNNEQITAGRFSSLHVTNVGSDLTTWMGLYGPAGTNALWQQYIWSDQIAYGWRPPKRGELNPVRIASPSPQTAGRPVTGFKVREVAFTQRRRTVGFGA